MKLNHAFKMMFIGLFVLANDSVGEESCFATFPDQYTIALWLFDEAMYPYATLCDAGPSYYDLRLMSKGILGPGKFGNALYLNGENGFNVSYAGFAGKVVNEHIREEDGKVSGLWGPTEGPEYLLQTLNSGQWTCEFWLQLAENPSESFLIDLGQGYKEGFSLLFTTSGKIELMSAYSGLKAICPTEISDLIDGKWHHLTFIQKGNNVYHFLDGIKQPAVSIEQMSKEPIPDLQRPRDREHEHRDFENLNYDDRRINRFNLAIGQSRTGQKTIHGKIDELRFSNLARYSGDFPLPESFARKYGAYGSSVSKPVVPNGPSPLFTGEQEDSVLNFGLRRHLFIDEELIDTLWGLKFVMNQPTNKLKTDFVPKKSAWRPSVVDIDNKVFLYIPEGYGSEEGRTHLYISEDGIKFTKAAESPIFDNLPLYGTFFKDTNPSINDEEKYKLTSWIGNRGIHLFFSPDGIHWRRNETTMLSLVSGGGAESYYDDQLGNYSCNIRRDASFNTDSCPGGVRQCILFRTQEPVKAWPFTALDNPYYEGWTLPAITCEGPVNFDATESGEAYRSRVIKYPWAPDVYLSFVWRYPRHLGDDPPRHVDLGVSRDGRNWKFFEPSQGWYIPTNTDADPEQLSIYGLIRRGDEIWQYTDHGGPHGGDPPRTYYRWSQRLDGFVSLDGTGTVMTKPILFSGSDVTLRVNSTGSLKIGILDKDGKPLKGYNPEDCDMITNNTNQIIHWKGRSDLSALSGLPLRLQFKLENAKLYSFELEGNDL